MKKKAMLFNLLIMTATSLLLRTVGISYRVFVTGKMGAEGMGLHSLIASVFMFGAILSTAGISTAVMRLVSEEMGRGLFGNIPRIMRRAATYALGVSGTAGLVMFVFAPFIGTHLLADERTILAIRILAPCLPLMSAAACFKGYFLAMRRAVIPSIGDVIEQFADMALFVLLIDILSPYGLAYACAAVTVGNTISEAVSCTFLLISYSADSRKKAHGKKRAGGEGRQLTRRLLSIAVPVASSSGLNAGLRTAENVMIPIGLRAFGASTADSLAMYGMVRGMAIPVLFFPAALLSAFSSLLIPELSEANIKSGPATLNHMMSRVLQITLLLSMLVAAVFLVFSNELGILIYNSPEAGRIMGLLAPLVPLMYLDMMVDGMLKGLDQQVAVLRYNIIDSLVRVSTVYLFVSTMGFPGFLLVMYISNILNPILSIRRLLVVTGLRLHTGKWILGPMLAAGAAALGVRTLLLYLNPSYTLQTVGLTVSILLVCFVYLALLMAMDCITESDLGWLHGSLRRRTAQRTK